MNWIIPFLYGHRRIPPLLTPKHANQPPRSSRRPQAKDILAIFSGLANGKTGALLDPVFIGMRVSDLFAAQDVVPSERRQIAAFNRLKTTLCATMEGSTSVAPVSVGDR
ncbi:hypothetical protein WGT02_04530 [Rhizobium sp. T1470]|uniref:hypothetical protein n=1 Tax=Rhizobium TaxID=379 RepID=UPI0013920027|nr:MULTISPECIES: hypothetical protein [Rhizobium]MCA0800581.1 hypothetical protein [Rhizobium sp. T1473]UFS84573.1 hypothetical protein LPB79_27130 [Rhizobium sp. T136]